MEFKKGDCIAFIDPLSKREFLGLFVYKYTNGTLCVKDGETNKFFKVLAEQVRLAVGDEIDIIKDEWNTILTLPHEEEINICRV